MLIDIATDGFAYFVREQNIILDEQQLISSILEQIKTAIIDGIRQDLTMKVKFSYENNSQSICTLKSIRIYQLLNNEHLLRHFNLINMSPNDYVLVLPENNDQILAHEDIRKPIEQYFTTDHQPVHFRISSVIQIRRYGDDQSQQFPLFNTRITMKELFDMVKGSDDDYRFLASDNTKTILNFNENFLGLKQTKFILVKEKEICRVEVKRSTEAPLITIDDIDELKPQQFTIFATITDVCHEYQINLENEYLLYAGDFIPSNDTPLSAFLPVTPIQFIVTNQILPIQIIIENTIDNRKIKYHCSRSMTMKRLHEIACQLFGINGQYYQLMHDDCVLDDEDMSLEDFLEPTVTQIELKLTTTATIKSSIRFGQQTIVLPCNYGTTASDLLKEVFQQLHIPEGNLPMFELIALADDVVQVEPENSIEEIYQLFSDTPEIIPFEMKKKE